VPEPEATETAAESEPETAATPDPVATSEENE
jgi:hypothetical protein